MNENVKFVPKRFNPLNVPQTCPIENFWGCFAQKVYEGGWEAKTEQQLIRSIKSKMKKFDKKFCGEPFRGGKSKSQIDR
jgi:hypothetical protein